MSAAPASSAPSKLLRRYGPVALVTGASDGIGEAFARELAAEGFHLVLVARRRDRLDALAQDLAGRFGISAVPLDADLGTPAGVAAVLEGTAGQDIGLAVAAAGFGSSGAFLDLPLEAELNMIDVNCRAVVALAHGLGGRMRARGSGGIVLLSSLVAFQGVGHAATYAASKAFVQSFAEGLRQEWSPLGLDVLAVAPGPIRSGFGARANMRLGATQPPSVVARAALQALGRRGTIRPGLLAKALELSLKPLPRAARTGMMSRIMKRMSGSA